MAEPPRPDPAKTHGRENWIFIPSIASPDLIPTVAEMTAASALDVTRIAFAGATPELGSSTERVKQDRRAGDTDAYEFLGETSYEGGDAVFAVQPQADTGTLGKKAWEKFAAGGVTGFIAKREDVARSVAPAVGQVLTSVMPVELGKGIPVKQGDGAAAQSAFRSTFAVTGEPKFMVEIAA